MENKIYYQWYPYRFRGGFYIEKPTEIELEKFYEMVRASDPRHESFVIIIDKRVNGDINRRTIDVYVKENILSYFFNR